MTNDTCRTYAASVLEVFRHLRTDHELIHDLAHGEDALKSWTKPGNEDHHQTPHTEISKTEHYLREIRGMETLCDLTKMYKALKAGTDVSPVVFKIIILKMLWIASGRGQVLQAA